MTSQFHTKDHSSLVRHRWQAANVADPSIPEWFKELFPAQGPPDCAAKYAGTAPANPTTYAWNRQLLDDFARNYAARPVNEDGSIPGFEGVTTNVSAGLDYAPIAAGEGRIRLPSAERLLSLLEISTLEEVIAWLQYHLPEVLAPSCSIDGQKFE